MTFVYDRSAQKMHRAEKSVITEGLLSAAKTALSLIAYVIEASALLLLNSILLSCRCRNIYRHWFPSLF